MHSVAGNEKIKCGLNVAAQQQKGRSRGQAGLCVWLAAWLDDQRV